MKDQTSILLQEIIEKCDEQHPEASDLLSIKVIATTALSQYESQSLIMDNNDINGEKNFQNRVNDWMQICFGEEISRDLTERNHRFIEEALELVQATGATQSECHQLVDYVFDRSIGEINQEIGGVMVTLAALCNVVGLDISKAGETELARIWTKVEKIREKQRNKPKHSPLPSQSLQSKGAGMWVKASERLPDNLHKKYFVRYINLKEDGHFWDGTKLKEYTDDGYELEYLDESPSIQEGDSGFANRIIITIHNHKKLNGMISVDSDDFCFYYCDTGTHTGLQCSYEEGGEEYLRLKKMCEDICEAYYLSTKK